MVRESLQHFNFILALYNSLRLKVKIEQNFYLY